MMKNSFKIFKKKSNQSSRGITLIALVITIIVLLILAGVSINMLTGQNGILNRAAEAKVTYNQAKENEQRELAMLEAKTSLANKEYVDSNEDKAIIPAGFAITGVEGETTIKNGLVITDSEGNEFVWIPVELEIEAGETFESKYPRTLFADNVPTTGLNTAYTEPYVDGYEGEDTEYRAMVNSVTEYGGFYVGRYETGFNGTEAKGTYTSYSSQPTTTDILKETKKLVVQKGSYVYNYVPWGSSMSDITAYNKGTTDAPEYVIGAVELSKNFAKANGYSGVRSTLIYGIQWDVMMRYVSDDEHNINDSSTWGNYDTSTGDALTNSGSSNMNYTTGRNEAWKAKNIYDIAGNVYEWIMEAYYYDIPAWNITVAQRICRGGFYFADSSVVPASCRVAWNPNVMQEITGFRLALYVE